MVTEKISKEHLRDEKVVEEINISTATLYRRLKELLLANVLVKDGRVYEMTEFGRQIYDEFLKTSMERGKIAPKEQHILRQLQEQKSSKKEILDNLSGSNTELLKRIDQLEEAGFIASEKPSKKKKRGRPASKYKLTKKGADAIEEVTNLKELAMQEPIKQQEDRSEQSSDSKTQGESNNE